MPIIHDPQRLLRGPITPPSPSPTRHAESTDARMGIRHDEEKPGRKKNQDPHQKLMLPEDVYDQTTLGIRALIDFLNQFLQTIEDKTHPTAIPSSKTENPTLTQPPPTQNIYAARAAQAYDRTAKCQVHEPRSTNEGTLATPSLLQSGEIRQIHELLVKLHRLNRHQIAGLHLYKADSFIQSLTQAADLALANLPIEISE